MTGLLMLAGAACAGRVESTEEKRQGPDEGGANNEETDGEEVDVIDSPPSDPEYDDDDYLPPTVATWQCDHPGLYLDEVCYLPEEWSERLAGVAGAGGELQCPAPEIMLPERPTHIDFCESLTLELCGSGWAVPFENAGAEDQLLCCYQAVVQSTPCN